MNLIIDTPEKLIFGKAPKPVKCGIDFSIGAGEVYPEINFTLPRSLQRQWKICGWLSRL